LQQCFKQSKKAALALLDLIWKYITLQKHFEVRQLPQVWVC